MTINPNSSSPYNIYPNQIPEPRDELRQKGSAENKSFKALPTDQISNEAKVLNSASFHIRSVHDKMLFDAIVNYISC